MKAELILGLCIVGLFASCSDDDSKKKAPMMDASGGSRPDAGSGGSGTTSGAGGQPEAAGAGGEPTPPDGGQGGQGGQGGAPGLLCDPPEVAAAGAGGEGGAPRLVGGEWHDFVTDMCMACPAEPIACDDFLGPPGPIFDLATRVLTVSLEPSHAQIVRASLDIDYSADVASGGQGGMGPLPPSGTVQVSGVIDKNLLSFDLSGKIPDDLLWLDGGWFTVTDACGTVSQNQPTNQSLYVELSDADGGGPMVVTGCHSYD